MSAVVLLHAGGWDELLMFVVPFVLFLGFRYVMYRREERADSGDAGTDPTTAGDEPRP